jgi:hypothetical protein
MKVFTHALDAAHPSTSRPPSSLVAAAGRLSSMVCICTPLQIDSLETHHLDQPVAIPGAVTR